MDFVSRQLLGIVEFDPGADVLLRIGWHSVDRAIVLPDGVSLRPGDPALELHLWNEHLTLPEAGADLRWAAALRRRFERSLERLAMAIEARPELGAARALMIKPAFTGRQRRKNPRRLPNLLRGGWIAVPKRPNLAERLHALIDDFWLFLLSRAFDPFKARERGFLRHRQEFWISRERFLARYGGAGAAASRRAEETARP
jgi:hypothetical protein